MEFQLQIYLIVGIGGGLIALLLLSSGLLIYYLWKLYDKVARESRRYRESSSAAPINAFYNNSGFDASLMDLDAELNRRYREYTPNTTMARTDNTRGDNKDNTTKSQTSKSVSKNSVISANQEFEWEQQSTLVIIKTDQQPQEQRLNDKETKETQEKF